MINKLNFKNIWLAILRANISNRNSYFQRFAKVCFLNFIRGRGKLE